MFTFCACYAPYTVKMRVHDNEVEWWITPPKFMHSLTNDAIDYEEDFDGFDPCFNVGLGDVAVSRQNLVEGDQRDFFVCRPFCLRKPFYFDTLKVELILSSFCNTCYDKVLPIIMAVRDLARHVDLVFLDKNRYPHQSFFNFSDTNDFLREGAETIRLLLNNISCSIQWYMLSPLVLVLLPLSISAGNILIFNPNLGHSHVRFMGNLADLYAKDGHNVTILTAVMDENVGLHGTTNPNVTKLAIRSPYLKQDHWNKLGMKNPSFWDREEFEGAAWDEWELFMDGWRLFYRGLLENKELIKSLQDSKFDLGLTELYEFGCMGVFEILGIKTTMLGAALGQISYHYDISGLPYFPSFIPGWVTTHGAEMSFYERLINIYSEIDMRLNSWRERAKIEALFREYYPNLPDFHELADKRVGVILSNVNEFTESPRPTTNLYQYVGGTNVHPPKPLEPEFNTYLNLRPATVLFSFGSFIKSCQMPGKLKNEILETFAAFPEVTFLWKYESCDNDTTSFKNYPNVIPKSWWPQTDLLGDDRIKAFITHAGMNSMLEVAFRGKPSITVPLFADQYVNAKTAQQVGMSTMIKRTQLGKKTLTEALKKALDPNGTLVKKAKMAADVLKGRGEEYRQEALRWARLLIQYGPMDHHRLPAKNLNIFQLYSIDCLLFVAMLPILGVLALWKMYKMLPSIRLVKRVEKPKKL